MITMTTKERCEHHDDRLVCAMKESWKAFSVSVSSRPASCELASKAWLISAAREPSAIWR